MNEDECGKCTKCNGEIVQGSNETLESDFGCTRVESQSRVPRLVKVKSYYCKNCSYIESYREMKEKKWEP